MKQIGIFVFVLFFDCSHFNLKSLSGEMFL